MPEVAYTCKTASVSKRPFACVALCVNSGTRSSHLSAFNTVKLDLEHEASISDTFT